MKKTLVSVIILFSLSFNALSHVEHYNKFNYLEYELFRNDKLIGHHKYNFERKNDILTIKSEVKFKITKLGVDLYKYFAASEEIYKAQAEGQQGEPQAGPTDAGAGAKGQAAGNESDVEDVDFEEVK